MSSQGHKFTVVSTFAGCGGSSLGYESAGGKVLLSVEFDPHAVQVYRDNFPHTDLFADDIAKLSVKDALIRTGLKPGELDIFDGSPPCQGFSLAGKRQLNDPRNALFTQYVRLLEGFMPKVFVMENVPGMVVGKMKVVFAQILQALKGAGYWVSARVLDSQYFGVPQRRKRMIFIGVRKDLGVKPSHPGALSRPISVGRAVADLPQDDSRTLTEQAYHYWLKLRPGQQFSKAHPKGHWFNGTKIDPKRPAPTVTKTVLPTGGGGGLYHWKYPRILNIPEVKRISSFPDDFILRGDFKDQWARLGNSVPPNLMRAIASHIRDEILGRPDVLQAG